MLLSHRRKAHYGHYHVRNIRNMKNICNKDTTKKAFYFFTIGTALKTNIVATLKEKNLLHLGANSSL